ncbi:G-protein coupled receptor 1 [Colletotrichum fructicola Nara gc5]|uniref:G-protein coupled receptor 1 n=1 Tax=Colletotrichum fructicola (strain Nara gc5) TaxID=1213859 RepID=A0A7J6IL82_COLFN|nr:G-protein coupled receptor 1 [Colletotrichum fructicola Nara gc5]
MRATIVLPRNEWDGALSAPPFQDEVRLQSIVILVVSIVSILGAGWIMLSFWLFPNLRSFRHRLILGLAMSDLIMAVNFLCSTAMNISGRLIGAPENATFCSYNGFMTQFFVIQTDYWVLTIAVCTYFILAGHKRQSTWIQNHEYLIWSLPWLFSTIWALIGLVKDAYRDIGAWCWFESDRTRLLVNFVPRWVIIATMFVLYAYLYVVLYRAHNELSSVVDEVSGHTTPVRSVDTSFQDDSFGGDRQARSSATLRRLRKIARLMLLYPLAYAVIWSLPTAIRIYNSTTEAAAPFALQTIDKASIVVQGLVDAVIYGLNETSWSSWRARLSRHGDLVDRHAGEEERLQNRRGQGLQPSSSHKMRLN